MRNILIFVFLTFLLLGCHHRGHDKYGFCPSLSDDITWTSYGSFELNNEGRDTTARRIARECDWHVQGGHNGGYGDTLQVSSDGEEVVFVWAYNSFYGFSVTRGWEGQTKEGVGMGVHFTEFAGVYPYFQFTSGTRAVYYDAYTRVIAYFDNFGYLQEIYVGYYLR